MLWSGVRRHEGELWGTLERKVVAAKDQLKGLRQNPQEGKRNIMKGGLCESQKRLQKSQKRNVPNSRKNTGTRNMRQVKSITFGI